MNDFTQKYRAWDLVKAKPVWISCFTFKPDGSIKDVEILDIIDGKATPEWRIDGADLILIRSTGLFDVNKKEIWEYDIVKQDVGNEFGSMTTMIGEMVWQVSGWSIKFESDSPVEFNGKCGAPLIIGNSFMHRDLLPKTKNVDKSAQAL